MERKLDQPDHRQTIKPQSEPVRVTYDPNMTKQEVIEALDQERRRFFRDWGNV